MPGYIFLQKFTSKELADLKGSLARVEEAKAAAQKMGIRVIGVWRTMGEYDAVTVVDAPNDEAASLLALGAASTGYIATETMRAFSEEEYKALVSKLP